ncbi:MAG TPA: AraC family transcriptional regulator [Steroidobacteraceae bacterium]|nr:AraC family transcriptional regulator [Steroidobacteraceae bacterium]
MAEIEQSWSTQHLQPGKALSYWRDVICENLLQMHIQSSHERAFFGHIEKHHFGPMKANFISVSEQKVWRDRTAPCNAKDHLFHLIHVRKGVQLIEQYGRSLKVVAGDCLLIDCLAGFEFDFPQGVEALVLEIQRDWLKGWLPAPEDAAARLIDGRSGWGATLASALSNVTPTTVGASGLPPTVVAEQIVSLLALAAARHDSIPSTHKRALLRRVTETIRERCHEPDLDPATVAAALGLSRRYVHLLFASAGTTFSEELYACRLHRAQRLLCDRRFDGLAIAEIAWNCGFSAPSHFTRRFRERFGSPPSAYRLNIAN